MRWPRGKYNGRRIVGFKISFDIQLDWWAIFLPNKFSYYLRIGPIGIRYETEYSDH
jgi:hypothetical protein